ncbi:hypothetical protein DYB38_004610 [Aphanomyces astaci]|uniref:HTH CENPB-type domain-containing protein n=1 Tax=Aphanomyces astaci TaxID=112090 RepID=A0A397D9P2_APHAT|nr:hypothetical protein DYB38_004610 [Aphanomyces astaci]
MPTPRSRYTTKELDAAVLTVLAGECGKIVSLKTRIPYSTLMRKMRESRAGTRKDPQRRGPKTLIPQPCEADLVAWIDAMQQNGYPPSRQAVLVKATQMLRRIDPLQTALTSGWYKKFRARHKDLTNRVAQVISRARNSVDEAGVDRMFNSVHKTVIENKLTADRIFNMDETAFASRRKSSTHGGVPKSYLQAYWIERRDVLRREMLTLPADEKKRASGRSTIDVGGRILTLELLHEVDKTKEQRQAATKRKNALKATRGKRGKPIVLSKEALMWARIAGSLGLAPLPNGRANAVRVDAVEYVL